MRINRLELENFRGFKKASVDFPKGNVAVFFGWNGAGKTAVLDAVAIILNGIIGKKHGVYLNDDDILVGEKMVIISADYLAGTQNLHFSTQKVVGNKSGDTTGTSSDWQDKYLPIIAYYKTNRELKQSNPRKTKNLSSSIIPPSNIISLGANDFLDFIEWFRDEEDIENQQKIENRDFNYESPRLRAIRHGVAEFLSKLNADFSDLKVRRQSNGEINFSKPSQKSELYIRKVGQELKLSQLSSGERSLILLVADIARRATILNPNKSLQSEGVVLIDEIEQHLHPKWQRAIIPALQATFPNIQFIIATHSPQVLSQVENGAVFEIDNFEIHPRDTYGRDNNWLLHVIMEDEERPEEVQSQLEEYFALIRTGQLDAAAKLRRQIEQKIGSDEPEFAKADVASAEKNAALPMKYIVKNPESQEFINWKEQNGEGISRKLQEGVDSDAVWSLLLSKPPRPETEVESSADFTKEHLRQALLEEQGYLCCYCNRPLQGNHTTTLEHFLPKDRGKYPHLVFAYENLLACCDGGERDKNKPRETYCDAKKGNQDPTSPIQIISPLEENCEALFEFDEMGNINAVGNDARAAATINFLGLDARALNTLRKRYINEHIMQIWSDDMDTTAEIASLRQKINGKFFPFCTAIISVLRNYP